MRGHLDIVDHLTERAGPALLLQKDILGCTPVHLAAVQNQVTLILKLVNALLKDEHGSTTLHVVARQRCMQVGRMGETPACLLSRRESGCGPESSSGGAPPLRALNLAPSKQPARSPTGYQALEVNVLSGLERVRGHPAPRV
jgi:hypothetical protein